jgi:D-isomer specific 2-hydroxyacid dehydrogenase, NAD binding domain
MGATEVHAKKLGIIGYGNIDSQLAVLAKAIGMRVIFYDRTDKLQHGNVHSRPKASMNCSPGPTLSRCTCPTRQNARHDHRARDPRHAVRRLFKQQCPQQGRPHRRSRCPSQRPAPPRRGDRCLPRRAQVQCRHIRLAITGSRQRHSDTTRRRFHRRGTGAYRLGSRPQVHRVIRRRHHGQRYQFPAGPALAA